MEYLYYYVLPARNKILDECYQGKINFSDNSTFFYFKKSLTIIYLTTTQVQLIEII